MPTRTPLSEAAAAAFHAHVAEHGVDASTESPADPGADLLAMLDGSVDDLEAALAGVENVADVNALITAEQAGKTRKTALAALVARRTAIEEGND